VNLTNGLVAHYPFAGNANDVSGNNNHGLPSGSVTYTADPWGNSANASNYGGTGSPGRVTVANSSTLQFTTGASFAMWFKLNSNVGTNGSGNIVAGGSHCIFSKDGDAGGGLWCLTALNGSNLSFSIGNVSMTTMTYVHPGYTVGQWLHLAYVMDAGIQRLYINGVEVATLTQPSNFGTMNTRQFCLGRFGSNWYPINGAIDEVRIYNRALNPAEITSLATSSSVTVTADNIAPSTICAGQSINVGFTSTPAPANGNTYTLQLSDATGSFAIPITIGTLVSSTATGTISGTVPAGVPSGTGYKVRILTDVPISIGAASTPSLTVNSVIGDIPLAGAFAYIGTLNNKHYYLSTAAATFATARTQAGNSGGVIAGVHNAATNAFFRANISATTFIGYTDEVTEGTWIWEDRLPTTYTNWAPGEPNNASNQDYASMLTNGTWDDLQTTSSHRYFMEVIAARNNSPVCSGSTLSFFGANLAGATYSWSGPGGFTSTQQNPVIPNATLANAGTYTLVITKGGCSETVTTSVTINQAPNVMGQNSSILSTLSSGLVLHYPLNGNANDVSGNNLNGAVLGGTTNIADRFGNANGAIQLNGTTGYIDAPDAVYFTGGDFTVSCWVRTPSYPNWCRMFDFGNGPSNNNVLLAISNSTTGRPTGETYNNTASGGQVTSATVQTGTNQWQLLTYTYQSGVGRIMLNGVQIAQANQAAPQNVLRTICYIGRSNWAADAYSNAAFDDFRIYNRALTTTEIWSLVLEQPDVMNLVAQPDTVCPGSGSSIRVIGSQRGVTYQLQNATTLANIGASQVGNGDTLSFATNNLTATTNFQLVATGANGCQVVITPLTVHVAAVAAAPTVTAGSRCEPGTVVLSASGATTGTYRWYTAPTGGTPIFVGQTFTTPYLFATTTYHVSIFQNGCESGRTAVTATINLATAPAVNIYSGLIVWYKADGNMVDSSGRGNNATVNFSAGYVNDRLGNANSAIDISSANYVNCGNPSDIQALSNQVTISMWVNQDAGNWGLFSPLVNKWAGNGLYMAIDNYYDIGAQQQMNRVRWRVNGTTFINSNTNVPYNTWHHIVCTYNGSQLRIYQNGVLTGSLNHTGTITNNGVNLQIGRQANGLGNAQYDGRWDEVRIYNRALNPDEVMTLYNNNSVAFANAPLCEGSTLQLSTPTIAGATYAWNGPNSFSSSAAVPPAITNVTAANAGTYSLVITNPNGCVSTPQLNNVVVNPLPQAATAVNDTVCSSGNAVLTASGGTTYQWYTVPTGGTPISGQTGATYTVNNLTATDTFYVVAVSPFGCEAPVRTPVIAVYQNAVNTSLTSIGSAACVNTAQIPVSVFNSQTGVQYVAFVNSNPVSSAVTGNGGTINLLANTSAWNAGNYTVTVQATQPGCGSINLTDTALITIYAAPSANITASGPLTFCAGDQVTLTAPAGLSYAWNTGATSQQITVSTAGSYSVTVTNANGCSATSGNTNVTVNAIPVANLTANGPLQFCAGNTVTLTASGGSSYLWNTGATTSSLVISTSGNYFCIVSNANCSDTTAMTVVTVNPLPSATVTASGPLTFCAGDQVTLTAPAGLSYAWNTGATSQQITATTSGTYSVTVTDANGCSASSSPINVTVNTTPVATLVTSGPLQFCAGNNVTLTAGGGSSYLWNTGATTAAITINTSGTYFCIVSNGNCSDTTAVTSVIVDPLPSANVTASGPLTFCSGDQVTLTADPGLSYAWSNGATSQSITVTQSGTYSVTVTGSNGCSAVSSNFNVNVLAPPVAQITASGNTTICSGDVVTLTATGGNTYLWSNGATTSSITVGSAGNYYVIAQNASCVDTSSIITVNVLPLPNVSFSMGNDTLFCVNSANYTLIGGTPAGGTYSGNGVSGNVFSPGVAGAGFTTIQYLYTDANGCSSSSFATVFVDVCTGIAGANDHTDVQVMPNPAHDFVQLTWNENLRPNSISIVDVSGKVVHTASCQTGNRTDINVERLASGVYFVHLIGADVAPVRLVIVR